MKNVSLYIARRYNTYTLLISLVIILITAFSIAALGYVGSSSKTIFQELLYPNTTLTPIQNGTVFGLSFLYVLLQIGLIYFLFNRLLKSKSRNLKLAIALGIGLVSSGLAAVLIVLNLNKTILMELTSLILLSIGLLSLV